jgi:TRAP-type C4-dicarboxylate transport system permease small subunit
VDQTYNILAVVLLGVTCWRTYNLKRDFWHVVVILLVSFQVNGMYFPVGAFVMAVYFVVGDLRLLAASRRGTQADV